MKEFDEKQAIKVMRGALSPESSNSMSMMRFLTLST